MDILASQFNRRQQRRSYGIFPVFVRGTSSDGQRIKTTTVADNLSQGGGFLQLPYRLRLGEQLFILAQLPGSARLAAIGRVVHTHRRAHGLLGVALCFRQTRLLPLLLGITPKEYRQFLPLS